MCFCYFEWYLIEDELHLLFGGETPLPYGACDLEDPPPHLPLGFDIVSGDITNEVCQKG